MCGSIGQREDLSSLCSVKGQDFRQTSQILFQLNSGCFSENLFFRPTCGFAADELDFCREISAAGRAALGGVCPQLSCHAPVTTQGGQLL